MKDFAIAVGWAGLLALAIFWGVGVASAVVHRTPDDPGRRQDPILNPPGASIVLRGLDRLRYAPKPVETEQQRQARYEDFCMNYAGSMPGDIEWDHCLKIQRQAEDAGMSVTGATRNGS